MSMELQEVIRRMGRCIQDKQIFWGWATLTDAAKRLVSFEIAPDILTAARPLLDELEAAWDAQDMAHFNVIRRHIESQHGLVLLVVGDARHDNPQRYWSAPSWDERRRR